MAIIFLESRELISTTAWQICLQYPMAFLVAAALGAAVNFASFLVIKATNALSLKILVAVRGAVFVLFCAALFGEAVTVLQAVGYAGALVSFLFYSLA
eukprot:m.183384 g.183384  ORF g.183384 m.183384 type:complete len:98 (+) comp16651_c1_seq2:970-1263(+)